MTCGGRGVEAMWVFSQLSSQGLKCIHIKYLRCPAPQLLHAYLDAMIRAPFHGTAQLEVLEIECGTSQWLQPGDEGSQYVVDLEALQPLLTEAMGSLRRLRIDAPYTACDGFETMFRSVASLADVQVYAHPTQLISSNAIGPARTCAGRAWLKGDDR